MSHQPRRDFLQLVMLEADALRMANQIGSLGAGLIIRPAISIKGDYVQSGIADTTFGATLSATQGNSHMMPGPAFEDCGRFRNSVGFTINDPRARFVIQRVEARGEIFDCDGSLIYDLDDEFEEALLLEQSPSGAMETPANNKVVALPERGGIQVATGPDLNTQGIQDDRTYGWWDFTLRAYAATELPGHIRDSYWLTPPRGDKPIERNSAGNSARAAGSLPSADMRSPKTLELLAKTYKAVQVPGSTWLNRVIRIQWNCCLGRLVWGDYTELPDPGPGRTYTSSTRSWEKAMIELSELEGSRRLDREKLRIDAHTAGGSLKESPSNRPPDPGRRNEKRLENMKKSGKLIGSIERRRPDDQQHDQRFVVEPAIGLAHVARVAADIPAWNISLPAPDVAPGKAQAPLFGPSSEKPMRRDDNATVVRPARNMGQLNVRIE